jgi:hypothetical protein
MWMAERELRARRAAARKHGRPVVPPAQNYEPGKVAQAGLGFFVIAAVAGVAGSLGRTGWAVLGSFAVIVFLAFVVWALTHPVDDAMRRVRVAAKRRRALQRQERKSR